MVSSATVSFGASILRMPPKPYSFVVPASIVRLHAVPVGSFHALLQPVLTEQGVEDRSVTSSLTP